MGFAEPELDELRRKRNGRIRAVRALLNIVLNGDRLRKLLSGEGRNISHGPPAEVKAILKNLVTILLEMLSGLLRIRANPVVGVALGLPAADLNEKRLFQSTNAAC